MEYLVKQIHKNMSWKDCSLECATLFHFCVNMFMDQHILKDNDILSKIKEYVIHYELQHHGSVHAHIILWVNENDLQKITNEIEAFILAIFNKITKTFIPPNDSLQFKLFKMLLQKELHECQKLLYLKSCNRTCKFGFPYSPHIEPNYSFNKKTNKWEYYRPQYEDQNAVPYHPTLLLLWGTHLNILCITSSHWFSYLLKYIIKCEPHGKLNLNTKNVE
jgi:hypothetical protein